MKSVLLVIVSVAAFAQTGTISGTVRDASGAVVPTAKVTAKQPATNSVRTVSTTGTGNYSFANLAPGVYDVSIEAPGFATYRFAQVELTVAQSLQLNATLSPGDLTQTIEISGDAVPVIELDTAQISNVIEEKKIVELPLITRNPYDLVLLSPGTMQSNSALGGFSVNGSRERNNNFLLDGLDNNDTSVPGSPGSGPSTLNPDAVQEFRVITNNFLAEYGRNTGAIIEVLTKSGTNTLRGTAYWFGRYNALAARDTFNPKGEPQHPFVRNMFGYSVGGPIKKDKTFFFVNDEWQRFRTTVTATSVVPTAEFKTGIFTYRGFRVNVRDANSPNNARRVPLDPTIQKVLALLPDPNGEAVDDVRGIYRFPSSSRQDSATLTSKFDHRFSDRHTAFLRYTYAGIRDPNPFFDELKPGFATIGSEGQSHSLAFHLTSALTPQFVNELRAGVNRIDAPFHCSGTDPLDSIRPRDAFGAGTDYNIAGIAGIGCGSLGASAGQSRRTGTWSFNDSVTVTHGRHNLKGGVEFRYVYENGYDAFGSRPQLDFSYFSTFGTPVVNINPSAPCRSNGTNCFGSTIQNMTAGLLGLVAQQSQSQFFDSNGNRTATDYRKFRQKEFGGFLQDVWKVRPNLSLTLGVRYQFYGVPYETNNNFSMLFADPSGPAPFEFTIVGPNRGGQIYNDDWNNFEPRIGFSWDPFGRSRTAVRGGYGIFHDRIFGNLFGNAKGNPPFQQDYNDFPEQRLSLVSLPPVQTPSATVEDEAFIQPVIISRDLRNPISQNWNFGIQHQITGTTFIDIAYVGSKANRIFRVVDGNPPQPSLIEQEIRKGTPEEALQFDALYTTFATINNTAFFSPSLIKTTANSTYHSMQVRAGRRYSRGIAIEGAYTWSHAIDDASDPLNPTSGNRSFPRNSLNLHQERGNSGFDTRHRLVIDYTAELPFGRGRRYLQHGVPAMVLGGWGLQGFSTFQTGVPYDIFTGDVDTQHTGLSNRVDLVGNPAIPANAPRNQTGPPITAFAVPPFGANRIPTLARNVFTGPGTINTDASLIKNTRFTERLNAQLRFEVFNVFNRPRYGQPGSSLSSPATFGLSTGTVLSSDGTTSNRQIQMALKLFF